MPMIQSSYPGNQSLTQVPGQGYGPTDYLQALLGRENTALTMQQQARGPAPNMGRQSPLGAAGAASNPAFEALAQRPQVQYQTPNESLLKSKQLEAQMAQADLATKQASAKPSDYGNMHANNIGDWGILVDPANVPGALHDTIKGGFYSYGDNPAMSQMYPGIVRQGVNGGTPIGGQDSSLDAQQMGAERASTQTTNLPGGAQQAHDDEMQKYALRQKYGR